MNAGRLPGTGPGRLRVRGSGEFLPHGYATRNDRHSIRFVVDGGVQHSFSSELYQFYPDEGNGRAFEREQILGRRGWVVVRSTGERFPPGYLVSDDPRGADFTVAVEDGGQHRFDRIHYQFVEPNDG